MTDKRFTFTSKSVCNTGLSYNETLEVTINDKENVINNFMFKFQGSIAGCGLAILRLFNGSPNDTYTLATKLEEELKKLAIAYGEAIAEFAGSGNVRMGTDRKGCVLATLGSTFNRKLETFILDMGFEKMVTFDNLAHASTNHTQTIYALIIKKKK